MYKKEDKEEKLTDAKCFGDFWNDISSLKITKGERAIQENPKSDDESGSKPKEKGQEKSRFKKYLTQVMLFNATPKVNLAG